MPLAHALGRQHRSQPLFQEAFVLNSSMSRWSRTAGFTFIEMLLVFVIMGIMLSITDMSARYGATLGAPSGKDTVQFDPRGFAVYVAPAPKFTVQIGTGTDTLCVTGLGRITTRS